MRPAEARTTVAGAGFLVVLLAVAGVVIARTPGDVLGGTDSSPSAFVMPSGEVEYTLVPGASAAEIGSELEAAGVIQSGRQFELLVSLMGVHNVIQADTYVFQRGMPAAAVIDRMVRGEAVPEVRLTFPEGIRIEEMAAIVEESGFATAGAFLEAVAAAEVPAGLLGVIPDGAGYERFQGFLFPDTYGMPVNATAADLVAYMLDTMAQRFSTELREAAAAQNLTPYEAVALASVVEREAVIADERPLIAGVFYNRLREGAPLEADPTTQFAIALDPASVAEFGYWKRELTQADLDNPSPYNTRVNAGLPPGPITNPGLAAIEAVAHPATTDYYYFFANAKEGDGSHVFAVTLDEHIQNVATYGE